MKIIVALLMSFILSGCVGGVNKQMTKNYQESLQAYKEAQAEVNKTCTAAVNACGSTDLASGADRALLASIASNCRALAMLTCGAGNRVKIPSQPRLYNPAQAWTNVTTSLINAGSVFGGYAGAAWLTDAQFDGISQVLDSTTGLVREVAPPLAPPAEPGTSITVGGDYVEGDYRSRQGDDFGDITNVGGNQGDTNNDSLIGDGNRVNSDNIETNTDNSDNSVTEIPQQEGD